MANPQPPSLSASRFPNLQSDCASRKINRTPARGSAGTGIWRSPEENFSVRSAAARSSLAFRMCSHWRNPSCFCASQPTPPAPRLTSAFHFIDVAKEAGLNAEDHFRRRTQEQVSARNHGLRRGLLRLRQRRLARHLPRQRHALEGFPKGEEPPQPPLQEQSRRHVHRRHCKGRTRALGWGQGVCVGDYDNDGNDDLFVTYFGKNVLYHNNGDGTFTDVSEKAGVAGKRNALGHRLRFRRLRPRRPARSLRRQLHRLRSHDRAGSRDRGRASTRA